MIFESDVLLNDPEDEFFPEDEVIDNCEDGVTDDDEEIIADSLNDKDIETLNQLQET